MDMSEGLGLMMPRVKPLEAMCKPRPFTLASVKGIELGTMGASTLHLHTHTQKQMHCELCNHKR
ncbi:unnamed protein product [Prunus armeniaca]|uniref:Uncharacterized protein n=1 Tax=Prunus armeniaca TaxID=36596 RepID=A0A6J5TSU5_PRUAR|nr:unnamed protein product [Prunus armeniaca]CAB4296847.1 unnamed protein product [Prunus armeniaca]